VRCLALIVLVGCAANAPDIALDPQGARVALDQFGAFRAAMENHDGAGGLVASQRAHSAVMCLFDQTECPGDAAQLKVGRASCTESECSAHMGIESWRFDASIGLADDTFSLHLTLMDSAYTQHVGYRSDLAGTVVASATRIDGAEQLTTQPIVSDLESPAWSIALTLREIELDATGCPIGGTLFAHYRMLVDGGAEEHGTLVFGPTCDVLHDGRSGDLR